MIRKLFEIGKTYKSDLLRGQVRSLDFVSDVNEVDVDGTIFLAVYSDRSLTKSQNSKVVTAISSHNSEDKSSEEIKADLAAGVETSIKAKLSSGAWSALTPEEIERLLS